MTAGRDLLASVGDDGTVRVWDPATSQVLHAIPIHYAAYGLARFNDGHLIVALSAGLLAVNVIPDKPKSAAERF